VTGEDGSVAWTDLPDEGQASVYVVHRTHASEQRWIDMSTARAIAIALEAGIDIRGRVLDAATLLPIAAAVVDTVGPGPKETRTDVDGRYSIAGLEPTVIKVTAEGYADAAVQLGSGTPLSYRQHWPERHVQNASEVDIHLVRTQTVTGRVVDRNGAPVAGAFLSVRSPSILWISGVSGEDGWFRFEGPWSGPARSAFGIREGPHDIAVFAPGHGRAIAPFDSSNLDVGDIVLPPPGSIEGRVLTPEGDPVPHAPVFLMHRMSESRRTDDLGRFRFPDLEAGTYSLGTQPEGAPNLWKNVELAAGRRVVADLRFESWQQIVVHVRTEGGAAVPGATVTIGTGFRMSQAVTGSDGRATLSVTGTPKLASVEPAVLDGDLRYRRPVAIELEGDEREVTFVVVLEGLVRGRVETPEGAPLAAAQVVALEGDRNVGVIGTRTDGTFEMQVPPDATFDLELTGKSYDSRPPKEPLRLLRGQVRGVRTGASDVVIKAEAVPVPRTLRVRVLSPDGEPATASVHASPSAWPFSVETKDGVAELRGLPDEEVRVSIGRSPLWRWLRPEPLRVVPAGQEVTLRFREARTIAGRVLMPDGSPAKGASIRAYRGNEEIDDAIADAEGQFRLAFEPSIEEPLRIRARFDGLTDSEQVGTVDPVLPGATGVEIRLAPAR
jgi:hypothetical protein